MIKKCFKSHEVCQIAIELLKKCNLSQNESHADVFKKCIEKKIIIQKYFYYWKKCVHKC